MRGSHEVHMLLRDAEIDDEPRAEIESEFVGRFGAP